MAAKKETARSDYEEVFIPRGQKNDDPNLFVSVNGKNYLLPRGQKSLVPPEVAYEVHRAERAENDYFERSAAMELANAKQ